MRWPANVDTPSDVDIFDQVSGGGKTDVFDEIDTPKADVFDEVSTPPPAAPKEQPFLSGSASGTAMTPPMELPTISEQDPRFPEVAAGVLGSRAVLDQILLPAKIDAFKLLSNAERERQTLDARVEAIKADQELQALPADAPLNVFQETRQRAIDARTRGEALQARTDDALPLSDFQQRLANQQKALEEKQAFTAKLNAEGDVPGFLGTLMNKLTSSAAGAGAEVARDIAPSIGTGAFESLNEFAGGAEEMAQLNQGVTGKLGRGVAVPTFLLAGNPAGTLGLVTATLKGAMDTRSQVFRQTGSRVEADKAAMETYPMLALYIGTGFAAAKGAAMMVPTNASPAIKGLTGFAGAELANVGTSAAMRIAEGQDYGLEELTADTLMALVQARGEYKGAVSERAQKRAEAELLSRGFSEEQIQKPFALANGETPASRVMAAPEKVEPFPAAETLPPAEEVAPTPTKVSDIVPAIRVGEEVVRGNVGETHEDVLTRFKQENPEREVEALMGFDSKENPNFFVDANGRELSRDQLEKEFGARDSQKLRELQAAEPERNLGPGAANIEEFQPSKPLGAKNAMVDEQRAARGLEPLTSEPRKKWGVVWDAVEQRAEKDPNWTTRLESDINEGLKKSVTDEEQAGLEWRMIDMHNKRVDAETRAADEQTYSPEERADFDSQVEFYEKELQLTEEANRKIGTQSGRALAIRKLIAYEDFTLAAMESRARRSKGEALTPEERTTIKTESEQAQKAQKVIKDAEDAAETGIDESIRAIEAEAAKDPEFTPEVRGIAERISEFFSRAADGARKRMAERRQKAFSNAFLDPTYYADAVIIGADWVNQGFKSFKRWAGKMVGEFGEEVKPHLDKLWKDVDVDIDKTIAAKVGAKNREKVKEQIKGTKAVATAESLGEKMKSRAAEGEKITKMTGDIDKLVRTLVAGGIKNRDALTDAVHDVLKTVDPAVTRRQAMDAISKYGDFKPLSKDEVSKTVRDLKQQLQLASKIEDVMAKTPLKRTGVERQPLSDEGRKMTKQLNELARELGIKITDPATQLKSIIGALETRLTNRIKDLKGEIAKGERTVKTRTPAPTSEKIESLRRELAEVEAQHEALLGKKGMSEEQRLKAYTSRTQKRIAEIERRLKEGDFEPPPKRKPLDLSKDPAAVKAKTTLENINRRFNERRLQWQRDKRNAFQKTKDFVADALASTRTLTTSADVSAPFRQGGVFSIGDLVFNPKRLATQMGQMFRSAVSEKGFNEQQAALKLRPNAELYKESGLYIADIDPEVTNKGLNFSQTEETMRGNLAEKLPLGLGKIVRGSNRAYAAFLNRQRADAFDVFVEAAGGKDAIKPQDAQFLAQAVNDLTGRGQGRQRDAAAMNWLAKYLFSPRFLLSRINTVLGAPIFRGKWTGPDAVSLKARRAVAFQYAKTAAAVTVVLGLASLMGAKVEKDPRSTDFLKVRLGNTRVDPMAGLQQVAVLLARSLGKQKVGSGEMKPTTFATLGNFVRGKLAPLPAAAIDLTFGGGKNVVGEPVTVGSAALKSVVPMSFQEPGKLFKEHGAVGGTVLQMLNLFGFGTTNYKPKER